MGENQFRRLARRAYAAVMTFAAAAYFILAHALIALHGRDSVLATAIGRDFKGIVSVVIWIAAIPLAFVSPWLSCGLFVLVAVIWLVPDRRIERTLARPT